MRMPLLFAYWAGTEEFSENIQHIINRYHKREFLLKFSKDRENWGCRMLDLHR